MSCEQMSLFSARAGGPFSVPAGDFARPGLVDRGFVERSVAAMRNLPDAEQSLRDDMAERMASIRAIELFYGHELNAWAAVTRERLWLEYFTAETILRSLSAAGRPSAGTMQLELGSTRAPACDWRRPAANAC
jgi:hypothetical protein